MDRMKGVCYKPNYARTDGTAMKLGVLASGRGSNLQALLDARVRGSLAAEVVVVGSDRPDAAALTRAQEAGIPAFVVDPESARARMKPDIENRFVELLRERGCDWLLLAGFFRIIGAPLLEAFPDRIANIHPSLLPAFPGLHAQRQAWEYGVRIAGCTVHLVDAGVDQGPILAQAAVAVDASDDEARLSARILEREHELLVATIDRIARVGFRRDGRRIVWGDEERGA